MLYSGPRPRPASLEKGGRAPDQFAHTLGEAIFEIWGPGGRTVSHGRDANPGRGRGTLNE